MKLHHTLLATAFITASNITLAGDLHINIIGIKESEGTISVSLFPLSKKEYFPIPKNVEQLTQKADTRGTSVTFKDILPGTYAISVLHDVNDNSEMDTFFGIPTEPYGNSGNYTNFKPDFDNSKFKVTNKNLTLDIEIH